MAITRRIFVKQVGIGALSMSLTPVLSKNFSIINNLGSQLPRSTPELQGMSSAGISSFLDAIEQSGIQFHSVMIVRNGNVVAEGWWAPYAAPLKHTLYSLSKSFTSTAVGFAVSEGKMSLEDTVLSFFPDEAPKEVSPNLAAMKVKHLLCMGSGHTKDTMPGMRDNVEDTSSWVKKFLQQPVDKEPGSWFFYNSGATYMCSAIVQKVTGQNILEYLKPRLFEPLGIEGMDWEMSPDGVAVGASGLRVKTEDIAKFGLLYLQKGKYNDKQILPPSWIDDALTSHIDNSNVRPRGKHPEDDWAQGYGYQFWRSQHGVRGDGAFGQFCFLLPEQNAVVAVTSESFNMQASMNLVWKNLLPAFLDKPQPKNNSALSALKSKLGKLDLTLPVANKTSPMANRISGKKFSIDKNDFNIESVSFLFNPDHYLISFKSDSEQQIKCGINTWILTDNFKTQTLFPIKGRPVVSTPLASSATWTDDNTLILTMRFTETAHGDQITFVFDSDKVNMRFLQSVAKGNPTTIDARPTITGKMA